MSLEAGRVGVRNDQVDVYGRVNPNSDFIVNLLKDLPAWTDLPVWKSGTEQLLPVNDDEPDTSPILCDIEYPVADLKNNQYFTYRQSATQKDGKAKIRGIRGKTLVWNQLQRNNAETQTVNEMVFTNNGDGSWKVNGTCTQFTQKSVGLTYAQGVVGHKYLFMGCPKITLPDGVSLRPYINGAAAAANVRDYGDGTVVECTVAGSIYGLITVSNANTTLNNIVFNPMIIDLTLLGIDTVTDKASFQQLFPLPSYAFNLGSLLDFTGTKVKTSNKNLLPTQTVSNTTEVTVTADKGAYTLNGTTTAHRQIIATSVVYLNAGTYTLSRNASAENNRVSVQLRSTDGNTKYADVKDTPVTFTLSSYTAVKFRITVDNGATLTNYIIRPQLEFGSSATEFEPYTTQETELPISIFFPTGMKSAGAVYDELTPTRAITRVGSFTFDGSEDWVMESQGDGAKNFFIRSTSTRPDDAKKATYNGIVASKDFHWRSSASDLTNVVYSGQSSGLVQVRVAADFISDIDTTKWKTYLTSNPITIHYELAVEDVQPTMSFDSE